MKGEIGDIHVEESHSKQGKEHYNLLQCTLIFKRRKT